MHERLVVVARAVDGLLDGLAEAEEELHERGGAVHLGARGELGERGEAGGEEVVDGGF